MQESAMLNVWVSHRGAEPKFFMQLQQDGFIINRGLGEDAVKRLLGNLANGVPTVYAHEHMLFSPLWHEIIFSENQFALTYRPDEGERAWLVNQMQEFLAQEI